MSDTKMEQLWATCAAWSAKVEELEIELAEAQAQIISLKGVIEELAKDLVLYQGMSASWYSQCRQAERQIADMRDVIHEGGML